MTEFGISMFVKPVQLINADASIEVMVFGRIMLVRLAQFWKAPSPIVLTELGIIVFMHPVMRVFVDVSIIALHLSLES